MIGNNFDSVKPVSQEVSSGVSKPTGVPVQDNVRKIGITVLDNHEKESVQSLGNSKREFKELTWTQKLYNFFVKIFQLPTKTKDSTFDRINKLSKEIKETEELIKQNKNLQYSIAEDFLQSDCGKKTSTEILLTIAGSEKNLRRAKGLEETFQEGAERLLAEDENFIFAWEKGLDYVETLGNLNEQIRQLKNRK